MQRAERPTVLFVTGHLPYPPVSGGRLRELELLTRLRDRYRFHLLVSSKTFDEDRANVAALTELFDRVEVWPAGRDPLPSCHRTAPELIRGIWSPGLTAAAKELLRTGDVDLVHVERFHLMCHLPEEVDVPVLLVEQNVEYSLWHQRMQLARNRRNRRAHVLEYAATVRAEIEAWRRADLLGAVTEEDAEIIRSAVPEKEVRVVPHGAAPLPRSPAERPEQRGSVVFPGNFAYRPNADAALFVCHEVFPRVRAAVPWARLVLVGNDPPADVRALAGDDIAVTGRVPSLEPYLLGAQVVLVPLREGGGIKAKVVEALTLRRAVVTTSIGAQGFGPDAAEGMRIEDRPAGLARATIDLLRDDSARRQLQFRARRLAASLPTWDQAAEDLAACYRDLLAAPEQRIRSLSGA